MKKIFYIGVPLFIFLFSCGGEKKKEIITGTDSTLSKELGANRDTSSKPQVFDPMAPPTADYSGDWVVKYKDSDITQVRGFFRFGKRHGKWASFYPDGKLWSETEYDNGVKSGKTIVWFPNQKIQYEGSFKEDARFGERKLYDETVKLVEKKKFESEKNK